jgi:hypothetical protein
MKCEIVSTGEVKHFSNNDVTAHTLINAGVLRLVENEPGDMVKAQNGGVFPVMQPAPEPRWYLAMAEVNNNGKIPALVFEIGTTTKVRFAGEPEDVAQAFGRRTVPADIAKQYAKLHEAFYKGKDRSAVGQIFDEIARAARLKGQ